MRSPALLLHGFRLILTNRICLGVRAASPDSRRQCDLSRVWGRSAVCRTSSASPSAAVTPSQRLSTRSSGWTRSGVMVRLFYERSICARRIDDGCIVWESRFLRHNETPRRAHVAPEAPPGPSRLASASQSQCFLAFASGRMLTGGRDSQQTAAARYALDQANKEFNVLNKEIAQKKKASRAPSGPSSRGAARPRRRSRGSTNRRPGLACGAPLLTPCCPRPAQAGENADDLIAKSNEYDKKIKAAQARGASPQPPARGRGASLIAQAFSPRPEPPLSPRRRRRRPPRPW